MVDCITRNMKPLNVPYPRWRGLILSRKEGCVEIHGIIIPIPALSSKIINVAPSQDDLPITARMKKWIENPYMVESSDSKEDNYNDDASNEEDSDDEDDNNVDAGDEEDNDAKNDDDSEVVNKEGSDEEEGTNKDEV
ncbi:unnamed protein product [Lactuca saligna]|uniref:Uncharacterized protein n=1 Tax=Lactuca saligna TaxID=75948 RepID=A0AA35ZRZ1_LACSI|nr:unnamed protein product [Lactuca saligna]